MINGNQFPPTDRDKEAIKRDKELMKAAKERVETRGFLKWMLGLGTGIWIFQLLLWLFTEDRGNPGAFMLSWGFVMLLMFIIFIPSMMKKGDENKKIMDEYEKLKSKDKGL